MYEVIATNRFKKDLKACKKSGWNIKSLLEVVDLLKMGKSLPESKRDHLLTGNFKGFRECHIEPDWVLVYKIDDGAVVLTLVRTGTHSKILKL